MSEKQEYLNSALPLGMIEFVLKTIHVAYVRVVAKLRLDLYNLECCVNNG